MSEKNSVSKYIPKKTLPIFPSFKKSERKFYQDTLLCTGIYLVDTNWLFPLIAESKMGNRVFKKFEKEAKDFQLEKMIEKLQEDISNFRDLRLHFRLDLDYLEVTKNSKNSLSPSTLKYKIGKYPKVKKTLVEIQVSEKLAVYLDFVYFSLLILDKTAEIFFKSPISPVIVASNKKIVALIMPMGAPKSEDLIFQTEGINYEK